MATILYLRGRCTIKLHDDDNVEYQSYEHYPIFKVAYLQISLKNMNYLTSNQL